MFSLLKTDGNARLGKFATRHGEFQTPAFMPVGTQATVKSVTPDELLNLGAQIILSNTYHLHLRPGDELIRDLGGLHSFMSWDGPILTDSGGYQVFSLSKLRKVSEEGVQFQSHHDGQRIFFTPEKVIAIQENLGVDIMMVLDECLAYPATETLAEESLSITLDWAKRSQDARTRREEISAFGIVQGGMFTNLRRRACAELVELNFDGYAIGGLSVGEPIELMLEIAECCTKELPEEKVRYLMGVGTPQDIVRAVRLGVDMFDCVIPTRSARFGRLYVENGFINIRNQKYRKDNSPIEQNCDCYTCRHFSKAYLSHLMHAKEVLALRLGTLHNLRFYQKLMGDIRQAIAESRFSEFASVFLSRILHSS